MKRRRRTQFMSDMETLLLFGYLTYLVGWWVLGSDGLR